MAGNRLSGEKDQQTLFERPEMKSNHVFMQSHSNFPRAAAAASLLPDALPPPDVDGNLTIGVVGSGNLGSTVAELWARAGHQVMFPSLDHAKALTASAVRQMLGTKS